MIDIGERVVLKKEYDMSILAEYGFEYDAERKEWRRPSQWLGRNLAFALTVVEETRVLGTMIWTTNNENDEFADSSINRIIYPTIQFMIYKFFELQE